MKGTMMENCPFCGRQAIIENEQGLPVCTAHKDKLMPEMRCACGQYLLMQKGKFGIFFNCLRCGNVSLKKALEYNDIMKPEPAKRVEETISKKGISKESNKPQNITIRSDDPDYFD
jgi:hypothetical protein